MAGIIGDPSSGNCIIDLEGAVHLQHIAVAKDATRSTDDQPLLVLNLAGHIAEDDRHDALYITSPEGLGLLVGAALNLAEKLGPDIKDRILAQSLKVASA
jgi:hypothetical protein